ncbi:MAG TPA: glycogen debranching protein GlgX [Calditrichaeota bacterium]|nr:glycogen debranching protein GlgX [Calditrichota bacterium]
MSADFSLNRGAPQPLGATPVRGGINFALLCPTAQSVWLVFFADCSDEILLELPLDPRINRTGNIWHALVQGYDPGLRYGYRVKCPTKDGDRRQLCYEDIVLLDPHARSTCGGEKWGQPLKLNRGERRHTFRLSQIPVEEFDWGNDQPLNTPLSETIIYELHVRGFTRHASSGVSAAGTFKGLTEKIPYLKELGITAVELMPVTDFDETHPGNRNPQTGELLYNYWGYDPVSFFAPKASYAHNKKPGGAVREFKKMVKALHKAGIEVILDMVFNHTGEGNEQGPVYHFKALANGLYYLLDEQGGYLNYSGCGNTLNCNHPVVRDMILDSLHYWVTEMHVDGFRFDLASILGRGRNGEVLANPPLIERIAEDPILANAKLIAEAWDASGLYQVGDFPAWQRWMEWNGKFRDDVRRFIRGEPGMVPRLATRLAGSSDLYQDDGREPFHSVNFITCHDGFTLNDLVSYNEKHNLANGENNRDGSDDNLSCNWGAEGETDSAEIQELRLRQIKNFAAILLLAQGVPMLLAGDEFRRTQRGNNNAYCQDNEISWLDWRLQKENSGLLRFFRLLIRFRKAHNQLRRAHFEVGNINGLPEMSWHGLRLNEPDWSDEARWLAVHYGPTKENKHQIFIIFNQDTGAHAFQLPPLKKGRWYRVMDTSLASPDDFSENEKKLEQIGQFVYNVDKHSTVLLIATER